jgi:transcription-repair coupling factor (superfamily II helicase)
MELEDAFPHEETGDQVTAIEEVKADLLRPRPMDRLICGDVGFGKTEIAVRAAFKVVMEGKQAAVLVPTTLLAEQHLITFGERYAPFPVKVAMLSALRLEAGPGAHRRGPAPRRDRRRDRDPSLLSADIGFKDLGLVVVDEEQRFGVAHKERLKKLRAQVDVLTMTATPIPRTLEMALAGIRDMSTVDTPPEDRLPVLTYVGQYDEGLALGAVRRELLREGQVFWVHNRVATIERQAAWLQEQVPDARIVVAHGQMDEDMLERRMIRFWDREADILMSTVIIESGLDVPNANTLVVDAANLLGLSQMYQLRGPRRAQPRAGVRVLLLPAAARADGGGARAPHDDRAAPGAGQRVPDRAPRPGDPGSGQRPRRRTARPHRGGGLRHVRAAAPGVGRGDAGRAPPEEKEIRIDLPLKAFVPPGWLEQEALRLDLYRRISSAGDHGLLERVRAETVDRFGQLPEEVETLFAVASLRITCARLGVTEVSTYRQQVRVKPLDLPEPLEADLRERVPGARYLRTTQTLNLDIGRVPGSELPRWWSAAWSGPWAKTRSLLR